MAWSLSGCACVAVAGGSSSDFTPQLGTSICLGWGPNKTKKKKEKKKEEEERLLCPGTPQGSAQFESIMVALSYILVSGSVNPHFSCLKWF